LPTTTFADSDVWVGSPSVLNTALDGPSTVMIAFRNR